MSTHLDPPEKRGEGEKIEKDSPLAIVVVTLQGKNTNDKENVLIVRVILSPASDLHLTPFGRGGGVVIEAYLIASFLFAPSNRGSRRERKAEQR